MHCPPGKEEKLPPERSNLILLSSTMVYLLGGLSSRDEGFWAVVLTVCCQLKSSVLLHTCMSKAHFVRAFFLEAWELILLCESVLHYRAGTGIIQDYEIGMDTPAPCPSILLTVAEGGELVCGLTSRCSCKLETHGQLELAKPAQVLCQQRAIQTATFATPPF